VDLLLVINDFVTISAILYMYTALAEYRFSVRKTAVILSVSVAVMFSAYVTLLFIIPDTAPAEAALLTLTLPSVFVFWAISRYRGFRFLFLFCCIDITSFIITFFARAVAGFFHDSSAVTLAASILLFLPYIFQIHRRCGRLRNAMDRMKSGWAGPAIIMCMTYIMIYIMLLYPNPIIRRPEYRPVMAAFCIFIACVIQIVIRMIDHIQHNQSLSEEKDLLAKLNNELSKTKFKYDTILSVSKDILFEYSWKNDAAIFYNLPDGSRIRNRCEANFLDSLEGAFLVYADDLDKIKSVCDRHKDYIQFRLADRQHPGQYLWHELYSRKMTDYSGDDLIVGVIRNIDQQKKEELRLRKETDCDVATGLFNKKAASRQIQDFIDSADHHNRGILIFIDIDNFKQINDTYGHPAGDAVLTAFAEYLRTVWNTDTILGRAGGDEFIVFLSKEYSRAQLEAPYESIREFSIVHNNIVVQISSSAGAAVYPQDGKSFQELYRNADDALYHSKQTGKGKLTFYRDIKNQP